MRKGANHSYGLSSASEASGSVAEEVSGQQEELTWWEVRGGIEAGAGRCHSHLG